jgi:spore coat protein U-like protein
MKTTLRLAVIAALIAISAPAFAATTTPSTFQVLAAVQRTCQVQLPTNLNFGTYDTMAVAAQPGSSTFETRCNRNTPFQIALDNGSNYGLAGGTYTTDRAMVSGGNYLAYRLYRSTGVTQPWGSTLGTNTLDGVAASSAWVQRTVYGLIPPGQDVPEAVNYLDATVTITVNY